MLADHLVGDRQEAPIGTFEAFYAGFVAQAADPFVGASRPVAGSTSLAALEPAGINILSPTEQGAEEVDFGSGRRLIRDWSIHACGGVSCTPRKIFS